MWTGGDNINLGIATTSIGQARLAAIAIDAKLQGKELEPIEKREMIRSEKLKLDWYKPIERTQRQIKSPDDRLANPYDEVDLGVTPDDALIECDRCFSCGRCFGCENCWMYCQANVFAKIDPPTPGHFFKIKKMEVCDGCKKCWEECPCGFIVGQ